MRRLFPLSLIPLAFCTFVWAVSCQEDPRDILPFRASDMRLPQPDLVFSADLTPADLRPADGPTDGATDGPRDGGDGGG
jgi:hypothetical protein